VTALRCDLRVTLVRRVTTRWVFSAVDAHRVLVTHRSGSGARHVELCETFGACGVLPTGGRSGEIPKANGEGVDEGHAAREQRDIGEVVIAKYWALCERLPSTVKHKAFQESGFACSAEAASVSQSVSQTEKQHFQSESTSPNAVLTTPKVTTDDHLEREWERSSKWLRGRLICCTHFTDGSGRSKLSLGRSLKDTTILS
jgi:hypothetical protein